MTQDNSYRPDQSQPTPSPLGYYPQPPRGGAGTTVAWIVIGLSVALVLTLSAVVDRTAAKTSKQTDRNLEFDIAARQLLGADWMYDMVGQHGDMKPLWEALNKVTLTPRDRVRTVPLLYEVEGPQPAASRLADLALSLDDPQISRDVRDLKALYALGNPALSEESKQRLIERHGDYARLAMAHTEGGNPQDRHIILRAAKRMMIAVVLFVGLVGAAAVAGVVLGIIAIVRYRSGTLLKGYVPDPHGRGVFLEAAAFYIAALSLALPLSLLESKLSEGIVGLMVYGLMALGIIGGVLWPTLRGLSWQQTRWGLGLFAWRGFLREVGAGIVGYITALPIIIVGFGLTVLLSRYFEKTTTHPIIHEIKAEPLRLIFIYALAAVWAPVTEELMFRGALFHHLRRRHGWWLSALAVAFIFAVIHPQGWLGVPLLMIIAVVLAGIREWRGSIIAPITAHALNNAAVITLTIFTVG